MGNGLVNPWPPLKHTPLRRKLRLKLFWASQRAMKKLRVPLYKAGIGLNHSAVAPVSMQAIPHSSALVHRASLQWMLTAFGQFLPDPALRTTLRRRLCLP
eukprot:1860108-Amphidinium_carterae.1